MLKYKNRKANIKIYIVPFFIITIIFIMVIFTVSNTIENYFYDLKKDEALKIAKSISINLSHTGEAVKTINKLLEDKLEDSLNMVEMHRDDYSDEFLAELANTFELDEIYIYNPEGIIEYSSSGEYIGWKAYEGHPVYDFMNGDEEILIEDIRRDSEREIYYKYGYSKRSDGYFIQIGILAEKVHDLLESFRLQDILEEIIVDSSIVQLHAFNSDYLIIASTNNDSIGLQLSEEVILTDINNGKTYDRINTTTGVDLYEIFVPLEYETDTIIAFGIWYSLDEMIPVIRKNRLIGLIGLITVYISSIHAIFSSYKRNRKLLQLAYYDNLTSLPNTESLKITLGEDIIRNKNNKAILMIQCDNLNLKNLTSGYEFGDKVLNELASRIKTLENENIQLFKFKADKFILYINNYNKKEDIIATIMKIKEVLNPPFIADNNSEDITIKIGVMEYNATDKSLDQLLRYANIALDNVDTSESNSYSFFNEDMKLIIQREEIIEKEIRAAINKNDTSKIYLVYQPIMDSKTNKIDGFEALARMNSEQFGFVSPVEFIDIAERTQLIIPLSNLIIRTACRFIANLLYRGVDDIRVAVNISSIHILQEDFVNTILNIIKETGINGRNLELEITETIMIDNFEVVNEKLKKLRSVGIHISLDDFGTGYSSFNRLMELNIDTLKIDQYFINKIKDTNKDSLITRDIISIAHRLGLKTVAEGVELHSQKDYLLEYDCDKLQGYLFSKPVPEEEAIILLEKYNNN